ncbi:MAG: tetratricopeptide repeat protein [Acaryochloris sp. RU_4_1]|nr:tetratricopeptide repeat protein [Acaryochloris sp. RU_4_1]
MLPIYRAVGDRKGEATTLNSIAKVYSNLGQNQKALEYLNQSLPISRAVGDRASEAITLIGIGNIYNILEENQKALEYYNQALSLRRIVGDRTNEATILYNIGIIYSDLGQKQKALEYYNQALFIKQAVGNRAGEATILNGIGNVYSKLGQNQKALAYLNQSLPISRAVGNREGEAATLKNIGNVYSDLGEKKKALEYYNQSLPIYRAVGHRAGEASTFSNIGSLLAEQKQPALAIFFYKQSVNIRESLRNDIRGLPKEIQQTYTQSVASAYRTLADLLLEQDRVLEAQQVLDLLKVQELEDYLTNVRGNAQTVKGIDYLQPEQQILAKFNEPLKTAIQLGEELSQLRKTPEANRTSAQQQRIGQLVKLETELRNQFNAFIKSPEILSYIQQLSYEAQEQSLNLPQLNALRDNLQNSTLSSFTPSSSKTVSNSSLPPQAHPPCVVLSLSRELNLIKPSWNFASL